MRIAIYSDLHLEFAPFDPPALDVDVVVLAGDIHVGKAGVEWAMQCFAGTPVIYVLGNHEYYGKRVFKLQKHIRRLTKGSNVHLLENESWHMDDVCFMGATLWTDFELYQNPTIAAFDAGQWMTDFQRIRIEPHYRKLKPLDTKRLHHESRNYLADTISHTAQKKKVVITHHAPSPRSLSANFVNERLSPSFASNMESFISRNRADLWVHGHIHVSKDYMVADTRIVCNPRGYVPDEPNIDFNPGLIIDI